MVPKEDIRKTVEELLLLLLLLHFFSVSYWKPATISFCTILSETTALSSSKPSNLREWVFSDQTGSSELPIWEKVDFIWYYEDVVSKRPVHWVFYTGREAHMITQSQSAAPQLLLSHGRSRGRTRSRLGDQIGIAIRGWLLSEMERRRKICMLVEVLTLLLLVGCVPSQIHASDADLIFYEPFDDSFEDRWVVSEKDDYKGTWKHSKSEGHDDYGLLISEKANKYAIVKELDESLTLIDGTVVLQYEVRLQNGLECGGAYLKYLRPQEAGWKAKDFDNESPYSIMFGPDKCGSTNKVHFIFKHKNPKSGEYVEHHLKFPPSVPSDKLSHVYTAIFNSKNELKILIDGEEKKKANFLSAEDFEPPLIPAKTIPDPDDKKPEDWDEVAKIPDPNAEKPDDWDEDAPMEIEDAEAVKPEGWLDNEPEEIDDPESTKPEDWDDEEDGEWEPPKIDNPNCEAGPGCGEWKRPMKTNPAYKGKWHAPLIDNPNYKGIWKPQEIPNPDYFEVEQPNLEPIAAIGIEIWTMQDGILFDNILVAGDEKVAESYLKTTWKPKFEIEKEKQRAEDAAAISKDGLSGLQKKVFDTLYKIVDVPFLVEYKPKIIDLIEKGEKQPNLTIGVIVSVLVIILTIFFKILFGGKKQVVTPPATNRPDTTEASNDQGSSEEKEEENGKEETAAPARRRSTRRET